MARNATRNSPPATRRYSIDSRTRRLNDIGQHDGDVVVYVMSRDQRTDDNHALLAAQDYAVERKLPLQVTFFLYPAVRHRNREQYRFMLGRLKARAGEKRCGH